MRCPLYWPSWSPWTLYNKPGSPGYGILQHSEGLGHLNDKPLKINLVHILTESSRLPILFSKTMVNFASFVLLVLAGCIVYGRGRGPYHLASSHHRASQQIVTLSYLRNALYLVTYSLFVYIWMYVAVRSQPGLELVAVLWTSTFFVVKHRLCAVTILNLWYLWYLRTLCRIKPWDLTVDLFSMPVATAGSWVLRYCLAAVANGCVNHWCITNQVNEVGGFPLEDKDLVWQTLWLY